MIEHRKRIQFLRIGLQLLYISLPPLFVLLLYMWFKGAKGNNLLDFLVGGLMCILVQALLLFRFFRQRISEDRYDLVKIIREQVQTLLGVVPLDLIEQKNRRKYYTPELSMNNRLFDPRAQSIYRTVTAQIRSQHPSDCQPRVRFLEEKCSLLQQRLKIMRSIYDFVIRNYEETSKVLAKVAGRHKKAPYTRQEFFVARDLLGGAGQARPLQLLQHNLSIARLTSRSMSWQHITDLIQQMGNINKTSWREVTELCSSLLNVLELDIRNLNAELVKRLRNYYAGYRDNEAKLQEIIQKLQDQNRKILTLEEEYKRVRKKHDSYEQELSAELNLELGRVELSNLDVKESNARDLLVSSAEEMYLECEKAQNQLKYHEETLDKNSRNLYKLLLEIEQRSAKYVLRCINKEMEAQQDQEDSDYRSFSRPTSPIDNAIERELAKFRKLSASQQNHKSFLKSFFQMIVVEDTRMCEQVIASCERLEREVASYAGPQLLENSVVRVLRQMNENRLKFVSVMRRVQHNISYRSMQYDEEAKENKKAIDALAATAAKQRAAIAKRTASQQDLRLYRLTEEQIASRVAHMENWSMGDVNHQLELLVAVSEQMMHNCNFIEAEITNSEALEREHSSHESEREEKFRYYESLLERDLPLDGELPADDVHSLNKLLDVFFAEWKDGEEFHVTTSVIQRIIEKELYLAFNRKRPDILDEFVIEHFKIENKQLPLIAGARTYPRSEAFHFLIDVELNFAGLINIAASSKIKIRNGIKLDIKIAAKKFICPMRICFTPLILGKSYISFLAEPQLELELEVRMGSLSLHKIPLAAKLIKSLLLMKIRAIAMWPNRLSIKIPLSLKDTRIEAIRERLRFIREQQAKSKMG